MRQQILLEQASSIKQQQQLYERLNKSASTNNVNIF